PPTPTLNELKDDASVPWGPIEEGSPIAVRLPGADVARQGVLPMEPKFDVRNQSQQAVRPLTMKEFCRLDVNGKLYEWQVPIQGGILHIACRQARTELPVTL